MIDQEQHLDQIVYPVTAHLSQGEIIRHVLSELRKDRMITVDPGRDLHLKECSKCRILYQRVLGTLTGPTEYLSDD